MIARTGLFEMDRSLSVHRKRVVGAMAIAALASASLAAIPTVPLRGRARACSERQPLAEFR